MTDPFLAATLLDPCFHHAVGMRPKLRTESFWWRDLEFHDRRICWDATKGGTYWFVAQVGKTTWRAIVSVDHKRVVEVEIEHQGDGRFAALDAARKQALRLRQALQHGIP